MVVSVTLSSMLYAFIRQFSYDNSLIDIEHFLIIPQNLVNYYHFK